MGKRFIEELRRKKIDRQVKDVKRANRRALTKVISRGKYGYGKTDAILKYFRDLMEA